MVIDTSAILAILSNEPEREHFTQLIVLTPPALVSAGTYLEARIVVEARWGRAGVRDFKLLLASTSMTVIPFDEDQAVIASDACSRYGRGRHPAGLNFGDCFSYALARKTGQPLLFKGVHFSRTDILSALHP